MAVDRRFFFQFIFFSKMSITNALGERNCEKLVAEEVSFAFTYSVSSLIRYEAFFNRFLHLPLFYFSPNRPYCKAELSNRLNHTWDLMKCRYWINRGNFICSGQLIHLISNKSLRINRFYIFEMLTKTSRIRKIYPDSKTRSVLQTWTYKHSTSIFSGRTPNLHFNFFFFFSIQFWTYWLRTVFGIKFGMVRIRCSI
jgi:hypothetical protein